MLSVWRSAKGRNRNTSARSTYQRAALSLDNDDENKREIENYLSIHERNHRCFLCNITLGKVGENVPIELADLRRRLIVRPDFDSKNGLLLPDKPRRCCWSGSPSSRDASLQPS